MNWTTLKTSKNTFNKAIGNYTTKIKKIDSNFLKLEHMSKTMKH